MESIQDIKRAEASPFIYGKIMEQLKYLPAPIYYGTSMILRWATVMVILGVLNIVTLKNVRTKSKTEPSNQQGLDAMAQEYFGFQQSDKYNY